MPKNSRSSERAARAVATPSDCPANEDRDGSEHQVQEVSRAPDPIRTPFAGDRPPSMPGDYQPADFGPPDWTKWGGMGYLDLWAVVALSLDMDPDRLKEKIYWGAASFGDDPFRICPKEFQARLGNAVSNLGVRLPYKPIGDIAAGYVVPVLAFVEYALQRGWSVPPEVAGDNVRRRPGVADATVGETADERRRRRLSRFRELGGDLESLGSAGAGSEAWRLKGKRGALAELTREEDAAKRSKAKRQDVTRDLKDAASAERMQT